MVHSWCPCYILRLQNSSFRSYSGSELVKLHGFNVDSNAVNYSKVVCIFYLIVASSLTAHLWGNVFFSFAKFAKKFPDQFLYRGVLSWKSPGRCTSILPKWAGSKNDFIRLWTKHASSITYASAGLSISGSPRASPAVMSSDGRCIPSQECISGAGHWWIALTPLSSPHPCHT